MSNISSITEDYSHLGVGELWIRRRGLAVPMRPIGNASELQFTIEQQTLTQQEFRSGGGGARNELKRITSVQASLNVFDFSPENVAMVIYGDASAVDATDPLSAPSAKVQTVTSYKGGLIPLDYMDVTVVSVIKPEGPGGTPAAVTYSASGATPDYIVQAGGVFIPTDSTIADGTVVEITYHHGKQYVIEAMTNSGYEFEASFRGYNEARSKHFSLDIWRLRFPPTESLSWIGDDFGQIQTSPSILSDASRPAGKSQYFRITMEA
jgi:hypothetical protein